MVYSLLVMAQQREIEGFRGIYRGPAKTKLKKKKKRSRLPAVILALGNPDKDFHEKWYKGRDLLDIPHPFRMINASKPNGGKTNLGKNIILRVAQGKTPFEQIVVVHCDPETTKEYDDLDDVCLLGTIPAVEEFDGELKTLIILEDLNYIDMGKVEQGRMERLFGYASTHKNISVLLTAQDPFRIMATARRCANFFNVWNNHDSTMIKTLALKTGVHKEKLQDAFHRLCPKVHDFLSIDLTDNSPAPFRLNGYEKINLAPTDDDQPLKKFKLLE